jgi:hypothetical protein
MVEVFKTNVIHAEDAEKIIDLIHNIFSNYKANFALEDCDHILRVQCRDGFVSPAQIISIVAQNGFEAIILPDDFEPNANLRKYAIALDNNSSSNFSE